MSSLPFGTVTILFTDIENSTPLWEKFPEAMKSALIKHDSILIRV
jgi:class 3 adenylate cyclase